MARNYYDISCYGQGRDGWMSFIADKEFDMEYSDYKQFESDYGTGVYLDVMPGLFAFGTKEQMKPFVKEDGTYGTGVCKDYRGNWMLRRTLWTDAEGIEHVAEGTVTDDGQIIEPIDIKEHKYEPNKVYPLTDSWKDIWYDLSLENDDKQGHHQNSFLEKRLFNLIVPLSFFEYLQHYYKMYSFGELSSRTFLTGIRPLNGTKLSLRMIVEYYMDYDDFPFDIDDWPMFAEAIISFDGEIIEPLHLSIPKNTTRKCYWDTYKDYLEKIANMPQPW